MAISVGEVELVEQRRLEQLGGGERTLDDGDRRVRVDDPPLRHRAEGEPVEAGGGEPGAEVVAEQSLAAAGPVAAQGLDVDRGRLGRRDPVDERRQPGRHAVARLMVAVVGVRAEEVLEVHGPLVEPEPEVELGHRELVGVGAQDAVAEPGWRHTSKATSVTWS